MILGGRSLIDLSIDDFQSLIDNHIPEGPHLDYKEIAYSGRDGDIREMLRDISSLANAEGGYLILGIREDVYERADTFTPLENPFALVQTIRQTCLDGIQERIPNIEIQAFETSPNWGIIVIFIPLSDKRPHMVSREHRTDFYRRYGTDKRSMTVGEIRDAFLTNPLYRRMIELEFLAQSPVNYQGEESEDKLPSYIQIITERPVARFVERYLLTSVEAQSMIIVSPYIGDLAEETYSLEDILNKAMKDRTNVYVITQEPRNEYHHSAIRMLKQRTNVEIRYNLNIHAKLYVCWSREEQDSFALFGSGNLTSSGFRHNIELGMMIHAKGYGRRLVRDLYNWGGFELRTSTTSQLIKSKSSIGD